MISKRLVAVALAGAFSTGLTQAASLEWVAIGPLPVPVILPGHVRLPVIVPPVIVPQVSVGHRAPAPVVYSPAHGHGYGYGFYGYGDRDRDGIPNRYDRVYNPRWDRDGVPNWRDRDAHHDRHARHDRHDRHDRNDGRRGHHGSR